MDKRFIELIREAMDEDSLEIGENDAFRDKEEWDSLAHLSLIALLDEEYGVEIEDEEFKTLKTFGDIYKTVQKKSGE
jgi:acyl carrier protein